jgi:polyphosphate kinase
MERNLDRRVEVLCPLKDPSIKRHIRDVVLETFLTDTHRAWELQPNGSYVRARPAEGTPPLNAQQALLEWYGKNVALPE